MTADWTGSLLLVGCGNMGGAMLEGWLAGGLAPSRFTVVDPLLPQVPEGVTLLGEMPDCVFDTVLLGVKPQLFPEIALPTARGIGPRTILLSIMAGVEIASLADIFPEQAGIVRIMPNLAAAIGKSPVAMAHRGLSEGRQAEISALMGPLGTPEWIEEDTFDLVTALAGSGPAFVYRFIDALASGAAELGLDRAQAQRLALAMVEGAALLAARSADAPGELARKVASPGGTTEAGLAVLDRDASLARLLEQTLRAAADRSAQIAQAARR